MARIDWAVLCDLAFFDLQDRLCAIGLSPDFRCQVCRSRSIKSC